MMNSKPTVMIVTAECWPLAKTGGLADIVYSMATSLRDSGFHVRIVIPGYRWILRDFVPMAKDCGRLHSLGYEAELVLDNLHGMELVVVRCGELFDRPGGIYIDDLRQPWVDNAERFGVLCHAAAMIANGRTEFAAPDLLHLQDWHAALTPAYLDDEADIPVVLTVQNFMFQGRFAVGEVSGLGLDGRRDVIAASRLFSGFSFLQVGLQLADVVTTAAPSYAAEMKRRDRFTWYYIKQRDEEKLVSITNWPETDVWNPRSDPVIEAIYDLHSLDRRSFNKAALESRLGWDHHEGPILCTLSRITKAKGFPFLFKQMDSLLERGFRIVIAGEGDTRLVNRAKNLQAANPDRVAVLTPYCEQDARRVLSGCDGLLMLSLTEPCGLSQQHAQVYGCVPIVSRVGGLPDTVSEGQTGFIFEPSDRLSFFAAIDRFLLSFRSPAWPSLQQNCMRHYETEPGRTGYADLFMRLHRARTVSRTPQPVCDEEG